MTDKPLNLPITVPEHRKIWVRVLMMIVAAMAFQVTAAALCLIAVVQLVLAAVSDAPNARLSELGLALGRYLQQIAAFVSFGSDDAPFPFADWPSGA